MSDKELIIMRGLPWTGKSYRAAELVGDGAIFSTDEYFYKILEPDRPDVYSFKRNFLKDAHRWNRVRAQNAVENGVSPIVIDNTNTTISEFLEYAKYAYWQDYDIRIEEPTSDRWKEIRPLLRDRRNNKTALRDWARKLEEGSRGVHDVPAFAIERMMWRWENDITPDKVITFILAS